MRKCTRESCEKGCQIAILNSNGSKHNERTIERPAPKVPDSF